MSRPRAGSGWTRVRVGMKRVDLIWARQGWITSGEAKDWPRCGRCRAPVEELYTDTNLCFWCARKVAPGDAKPEREHGDPVREHRAWSRARQALHGIEEAPDWREHLRQSREVYALAFQVSDEVLAAEARMGRIEADLFRAKMRAHNATLPGWVPLESEEGIAIFDGFATKDGGYQTDGEGNIRSIPQAEMIYRVARYTASRTGAMP